MPVGSFCHSTWLTVAWWFVSVWGPAGAVTETAPPDELRWSQARDRMVREDVVGAGVCDERVCAALRDTPRHLFVAESQRQYAYLDIALPIGAAQTISSPYIVARMTERLDPQPQDKVLEIGTGSGYQAAVLSSLVADVYTIEIVEALGRTAAETLRRLNYTNVHTRIGDGYLGWPESAPFDKIIVTCSPERVPEALLEQLREGGRMVIPLGERFQQTLFLLKKTEGKIETEAVEPTFFVPMTGRAERLRRKKDEPGTPELVNASFELASEDGAPAGWYNVRQAAVKAHPQAPDGRQILHFCNDVPGRASMALQSLAVDGRRVRELDVSLWIKTDEVRAGPGAGQLPHLELVFFNDQRVVVGSGVLGPWRGVGTWAKQRVRLKVPGDARLAGLVVGLFGAIGQLSIDQLTVEPRDARLP